MGSSELPGSPGNPSACQICREISLWEESGLWALKTQTSVQRRTLRAEVSLQPIPAVLPLGRLQWLPARQDRQPVLLHNLVPILILAPPSS